MMPNISTARANDRSQLVSLKFMMPRSVSGPSERSCFASAAPMERAYLDYSGLRCSKPDTGAAVISAKGLRAACQSADRWGACRLRQLEKPDALQ